MVVLHRCPAGRLFARGTPETGALSHEVARRELKDESVLYLVKARVFFGQKRLGSESLFHQA